jgi:hypothetical protein
VDIDSTGIGLYQFYMGFVDETKRRRSASLAGKLLVTFCILLAAVSIGITLWVGGTYYFSPHRYALIPLGIYLPLASIIACSLTCAGLIYLFKKTGYRKE